MKSKTKPICKTYPSGSKVWWLNGKYHRTDGPAIEFTNGDKIWYVNGLRHRIDGSALEYVDGTKEWWLNGYCFATKQELIKAALKQKLITKEEAFILLI